MALMQLKILLPGKVFLETSDVKRIVAETTQGYYGFLPRRLDCVTALVPGILLYESAKEGEVRVAVDEGLLVKTGFSVLISVRNALSGFTLGTLRETYLKEMGTIRERETHVRSTVSRLESSFLRKLSEFRRTT